MIDLNKKYKTNHGWDVVLLDIVENKVFGRYYNPVLQQWYSTEWKISTEKCQVVSVIGDNYTLIEVPNFEIKNLNCKYVNYFGYKLYVPNWANWISTNADGEVWVYVNKPTIGIARYLQDCDNGFNILPKIEFEGNWRNSLMEIK